MEKLYRFLDLTHTLEEGIPLWDSSCLYKTKLKGKDEAFKLFQVEMDCGVGTHIDAPSHLHKKMSVDQIPLEKLIVPCRTLHIKEATESYTLSLKELLAFEAHNGLIEKDQFVLIHTGWDRFWDQPELYQNNYQFPSISVDAAHYLAEKNIVGLGIDTLSPDKGNDSFPVHQILLSKNIYIIENVANAKEMPPNATVGILPMKGGRLSEAPVRMVGIIKETA